MLGQHVLGKATRQVRSPMAYVARAFKDTPAELQQWIDMEVTS